MSVQLLRSASTGSSRAYRYRHLPRAAAVSGACLLGLVALFLVLQALTLTFTHDKGIGRRLYTAAHTGILTEPNFPLSAYGHTSLDYDLFTECLALSTNLGNEKTKSLMYRLAATPYGHAYENNPCQYLVRDVRAQTFDPAQPYFRYWHGHQVYLRPLLANTSLENVHIITALLLIAAVTAFTSVLVRQFGWLAAPLLIIPLAACTNILTVPASTVHALSYIWAFISLAVMAHHIARREINTPFMLGLVFALACVAAFFDVLFSPPFAPTLMAFLAIATGLQRKPVAPAVYDAGVLVFFWFAGFSLAWMSKWAFASAVLGWDAVKPGLLDAITVRGINSTVIAPEARQIFAAVKAAFAVQNHSMIYYSAAIGGLAVAAALVTSRRKGQLLLRVAALLSPLLIPVIWVELLRGHTIVHPQFAARAFAHFAIIPLMIGLYIWSRRSVLEYTPFAHVRISEYLRLWLRRVGPQPMPAEDDTRESVRRPMARAASR